jgi:BlaI family penicillinase repressor
VRAIIAPLERLLSTVDCSRKSYKLGHTELKSRKFTASELKVMTALWDRGPIAIREILETYPKKKRLAYTTVQTLVYRLEEKGAVRRTRKIGGAFIYEAVVSRQVAGHRLLDELMDLFGGRAQPVMSHLIECGKLTDEDVEAARRQLRDSRRNRVKKLPTE